MASRIGRVGALALLLGCSASRLPPGETPGDGPVQLPVKLSTGELTDLARYQGKPLLVFLFATYDSASQLALMPLLDLQAAHGELQLLGIALQPDAEAFLGPYASALSVSFPLGFDPQAQVLGGQTSLGPIPAIPCYVLIDAAGRVRARHVGILEAEPLDDFVAPVLP